MAAHMTASIELDPLRLSTLVNELHRCVKKDSLVKAKFLLKGLSKSQRRQIVSQKVNDNAPLFDAAKAGSVYFVNFFVDECGADIEQRGIYEVVDDGSKHEVTPLWCAAVANKLDIVKALVKLGAKVDSLSDTLSTPVRSACFMSNIEVVRFLVDHGADIHLPNINGGTCLINSVQSVEICEFLIKRGAAVNAADNSGNLALHYAIREERLETVKLLLAHKSDPFMKNDFGDDAIQTATLRGYTELLEYLLDTIKPGLHRRIDAYELIATNFIDEKHDLQKALVFWKHAMKLRYSDGNNVLLKPEVSEANPAYLCLSEPNTMTELDEMATHPDLLYILALLVRERILGVNHKDTVFGLMYRGAVYADSKHYQRSVDLWKYAFKLRHRRKDRLSHECLFTLEALCKLFCEIHDEAVRFSETTELLQYRDLMDVLEWSIQEVEWGMVALREKPVHLKHMTDFEELLVLVIHMIHLMCEIDISHEEKLYFYKQVHHLISIKPINLINNASILHLAIDSRSSFIADEFYTNLPSEQVVRVFIHCGADVNARDEDGNTPLHMCGIVGNLPVSAASVKVQEDTVKLLLQSGSHYDVRNGDGVPAYHMILTFCPTLLPFQYITLKCIAAHVIRKNNIKYDNEVPKSLIPFIELH